MERFRNRQERVEILGNKMKMFNNLFFKNFGDEMPEDEMKRMFEPLATTFKKLIFRSNYIVPTLIRNLQKKVYNIYRSGTRQTSYSLWSTGCLNLIENWLVSR
jgi:DUF438 domain-containing protein